MPQIETSRPAIAERATALGTAGHLRPASAAEHPVLIMNLKSGGRKAERFRLAEECRKRGIEPVVLEPGDDLLQLAEDAVARGADVIGMAGGDGSQALIATVAARHGIPHVCVPGLDDHGTGPDGGRPAAAATWAREVTLRGCGRSRLTLDR